METAKVVGFDSEWCHCGCGYYMACFTDRPTVLKRDEVDLSGVEVAAHNARADFRALGQYPDVPIWDTLMLAWLLNENGRHGLKAVAPTYLARDLEDPIRVEDGQTQFKVGHRYVHITDAPQEDVERYCKEDARAARDLALFLWPQLTDHSRDWYLTYERPFDRLLYDMENRGVQVDLDLLFTETVTLRQQVDEARKAIWGAVGYEFNIDSAQQMGNILYTKTWTTKEKRVVGQYKTGRDKVRWVDVDRSGFGLRCRRYTDGGKPSTDDDALQGLLTEYHGSEAGLFVQQVLDYREATKVLSTYLEAFPRYIGADGRLRGHFNAAGTVTGRLSSSDPNLQNIPARGPLGKRVRNLFVAGPGRVLVVADLDQIELRLIASFSGDPTLVNAFNTGDDVHLATAKVMGSSVRDVGKTLNYALGYGAGPKKIAETLTASGVPTRPKQARALIDKYYDALSGVTTWKEKVLDFARRNGGVVTLGRRVRHLPYIRSRDGALQSRAERQAVNAAIQGSAADLFKWWTLEVQHLDLLLSVHDELVVEADASDADRVVRELKEGLARVVGPLNLKVPVLCEPKVVSRWGDAK